MSANNINMASRLAILFSEEVDIPTRFKDKDKKKGKKQTNIPKNKENSAVEQRFKDKIKSWEKFINIMTSNITENQALRFINLKPEIEPNLISAAYCKDFQDFTDYFVLRRDIENCEEEELGQLAQLHTAFQKEIERRIS